MCFFLFSVLQAMFINGVKEAFSEGNIFYKLRLFLNKYVNEFWQKPLYSCIKCMASFWGVITFFPIVYYIYGFKWVEVVICIFNIGVVSFLNNFFYKRV
jgi:hypothetical protein